VSGTLWRDGSVSFRGHRTRYWVAGEADVAGRLPLLVVHGGPGWVVFEESSHMPHLEEPERFLDVVGAFLRRVEEGHA
jgi:hypothetical protein